MPSATDGLLLESLLIHALAIWMARCWLSAYPMASTTRSGFWSTDNRPAQWPTVRSVSMPATASVGAHNVRAAMSIMIFMVSPLFVEVRYIKLYVLILQAKKTQHKNKLAL